MDEDSDEELEDRDEVMEPCVQSSSSSEMKMILKKLKFRFGLQEPGILQISWILLDLQVALTVQLPPI